MCAENFDPGIQPIQPGADKHNRIGRRRRRPERPKCVARRRKARMGGLQIAQRVSWVRSQLAVTQPVQRRWLQPVGIGQSEDPGFNRGGATLRHKAAGMGIHLLESVIPQPRCQQLRNRHIDVPARCQQIGGLGPQRLQCIRRKAGNRPAAQKLAEQGVKGVRRLGLLAPIREQTAARHIRQPLARLQVVANGVRHRLGCAGQKSDALHGGGL